MSNHLLIMAAGTGGHIMPGLAVAREMLSRGWTVSWLGTRHGMENRIVPPSDIELDTINFAGLRGKGLFGTLLGGFKLLGAFWQSLMIVRKRKPAVVLGMGGYVCFPGGLMASWLSKPLVLMNADAELLLSNKSLLSVADTVCFGFEGDAVKEVKQAVVTGNPVRHDIFAIPVPLSRFNGRSGALRVLVVGGSLGAQVLNECVPKALALLSNNERPMVTHQSGEKHFDTLKQTYQQAGITAEIVPFIDNMAERMRACDVMICRSGAITVSELCAAGVASILVPFVASTTAHQVGNAQWLAQSGGAIHVPQAEFTPERLAALLRGLTRAELQAMASKARSRSMPDATERVADQIEMLV
jgi:UDP-N-acetylglucosamine--N-acetylmuramyl-(pentapeptide) pyrophosphoryl-undecaprenol N-acetylglucosamine transferase